MTDKFTEPKPPVKGELLEDVGRVLNDARKYMGRGYLGDQAELYERIGNVHRAVINASRDVTTPTVIIPADDFARILTALENVRAYAEDAHPEGKFDEVNAAYAIARKYGSAE